LTSIIYKAQKLELDVHSESKPGRGVCFREATNSGERSVKEPVRHTEPAKSTRNIHFNKLCIARRGCGLEEVLSFVCPKF